MDDMRAYLEEIAALGKNGDTMLAHINPQEAAVLKEMGGSGTINPDTGLPQFFLEDLFGGIGDFFGSVGSGISDLFGGGGGAAAGAADTALGGAGSWGLNAGDLAAQGGGSVMDSFGSFPGATYDAGAGAGAAASGGGGLLGGAGDWLGRNSSWLIPAAGLGYAALKSNQSVPYQGQIQSGAKDLKQSAGALTSPLLKGTPLPAGAQTAVDLSANANAAGVRNSFANMGLSGSSMEGQALQAVEQQKSAQTFQDALALATQGFTNIGAANQAYGQLANSVLASDAAFTNALASFAGSLGRTGGLNYVRPA